MGKYESLARYLESREDDSWTATFEQIEAKLGFPLPPSAHEHRAWWSNQKGAGHSQKAGWQTAGWETSDVDLRNRVVRFERKAHELGTSQDISKYSISHMSDLWKRVRQITGIEDQDQLIEAALTALIQREAALALTQMGGTMPDAQAAPRERPFG